MKVLLFLVSVTVASALGVVDLKYRTRLLFSEVQRLQQTNDAYEEELAQLQFEQNKWAERERVDKIARDRLGMTLPDADSILPLKP